MQRWKIQRQNVLTKCTTENDQMKKWGKWMTKNHMKSWWKPLLMQNVQQNMQWKLAFSGKLSHGPQCVVSKKSDRMEVSRY